VAKREKRGNGEGSIYRKADGRWVAQYAIETAQGTKRKTLYGKTRREVAEKLRAAQAERLSRVEQVTSLRYGRYSSR
jgi:hypothetical protein